MPRQEYTGRSAAEAAILACEQLGLTRSELSYDVVSETGEGLNRRVVIAVDTDAPARSASSSERTESAGRPMREDRPPRRESRGRDDDRSDRRPSGRGSRMDRDRSRGDRESREGRERAEPSVDSMLTIEPLPVNAQARPELTGELTDKVTQAKSMLNEMLRLMNVKATSHVVQDDEQEAYLDIVGEDASRIIGTQGEPLLSLQFLLNRMLSHQFESEQIVVLDVAGYRERRRVALAELAKKLADRAINEHKVVKMSLMSAHDRRVFHMTLSEMNGVTTQSEGEGLYRHLLIIPSAFVS